MIEQPNQLPHPIYVYDAVLHLYPSPAGPQHDECKAGFPGIWGKLGLRHIPRRGYIIRRGRSRVIIERPKVE